MDVSGNTLAFLVLLILWFLSGLSATNLDCGGVYTENEVTIESPTYINSLNRTVTCEFIFKDDKCSTQYFFHFVNFYLDETSDCSASGLEVEGQGILCGYRNKTEVYYSQYGVLRVKFYSRQLPDEKFKILVTKIPCDSNFANTRLKRSFDQTCKSFEIPTVFQASQGPPYYYNNIQWPLIKEQNTVRKACCAARYDSKHFLLSSPNFRYGKNNAADCVYHIYRANNNICKIRFNFLYYWNGEQTVNGCDGGYIEIDGKRICGCNTGLKLEAAFDRQYGNIPKVIRYKSNDHSERIGGFTIEVFQEECLSYNNFKCSGWGQKEWYALANHTLWRYTPECKSEKSPTKCLEIRNRSGCLKSPGYPFYYPDNLNLCYRFIKSPGYCSVKLIILDFLIQHSYQCTKDYVLLGNGKRYCGHQLYNTFSILTFANGTFEDFVFVTDDRISCRGFKAWFVQMPCEHPDPTTKKPLTTRAPTIPPTTITYPITTTPTTKKPVTTQPPTLPPSTVTYPVTTTTEEPLTTPHPTTPPTTIPTTTITSPVTTVFTTIFTTIFTTEQPTTPIPTTIFVTTEVPSTEYTSTEPDITTAPSPCIEEYREKSFQIDLNYVSLVDNTCSFVIYKNEPGSCQLTLKFPSITCRDGDLVINNRKYCDTDVVEIDFYSNNITIVYNKASSKQGGGFVISGSQTSDCIPDIEFPGNLANTETPKEWQSLPSPDPDKEYVTDPYEIVVVKNTTGEHEYTINNLNDEMCGLQINVTSHINREPDNNVCNFLKHFERRVQCIPLTNHSMYAPYFEKKIEIKVPSEEVFESMLFKEVRCGDSAASYMSN
ncbi:hypothetical protein Trydic_g8118 [Trypoxylus dichotomus]